MKKLIPILSLAVLSSCSHTTKVNANLAPSLQEDFSHQIADVSSVNQQNTTSKKIKKVVTKSTKIQGIASWYGNYFHGKKNRNRRIIRYECDDSRTQQFAA